MTAPFIHPHRLAQTTRDWTAIGAYSVNPKRESEPTISEGWWYVYGALAAGVAIWVSCFIMGRGGL